MALEINIVAILHRLHISNKLHIVDKTGILLPTRGSPAFSRNLPSKTNWVWPYLVHSLEAYFATLAGLNDIEIKPCIRSRHVT